MAQPNLQSFDEFLEAVIAGALPDVQRRWPHIDPQDRDGVAFRAAASRGHVGVVRLFLTEVTDPVQRQRALLWAVRHQHHKVVEILLDHVDRHMQCEALVVAMEKGHVAIMNIILESLEPLCHLQALFQVPPQPESSPPSSQQQPTEQPQEQMVQKAFQHGLNRAIQSGHVSMFNAIASHPFITCHYDVIVKKNHRTFEQALSALWCVNRMKQQQSSPSSIKQIELDIMFDMAKYHASWKKWLDDQPPTDLLNDVLDILKSMITPDLIRRFMMHAENDVMRRKGVAWASVFHAYWDAPQLQAMLNNPYIQTLWDLPPPITQDNVLTAPMRARLEGQWLTQQMPAVSNPAPLKKM